MLEVASVAVTVQETIPAKMSEEVLPDLIDDRLIPPMRSLEPLFRWHHGLP